MTAIKLRVERHKIKENTRKLDDIKPAQQHIRSVQNLKPLEIFVLKKIPNLR